MRGIAKLIRVNKRSWVWTVYDEYGTAIATERHPVGGRPDDCQLDFNGIAPEAAA